MIQKDHLYHNKQVLSTFKGHCKTTEGQRYVWQYLQAISNPMGLFKRHSDTRALKYSPAWTIFERKSKILRKTDIHFTWQHLRRVKLVSIFNHSIILRW